MKKLALFIVLTFWLGHANAVPTTFDFQELTDTNTGQISGTWADGSIFALANSGERAFQEFNWIKDGIKLTASATYTGSATYTDSYSGAYSSGETLKAWAYLDQNNAGLGVCSKGLKTDGKGANQCNPGSDDNVTVDEILNILFDQVVTIDFSQSVFRDGSHNDYTPPDPYVEVSVNGGAFELMDVSSVITGSSFDFLTNSDNDQFYIDALAVTSVPEPSILAMMGLGIAGIGFTRRRKI